MRRAGRIVLAKLAELVAMAIGLVVFLLADVSRLHTGDSQRRHPLD